MRYENSIYFADSDKIFRKTSTQEIMGKEMYLNKGDIINSYQEIPCPTAITLSQTDINLNKDATHQITHTIEGGSGVSQLVTYRAFNNGVLSVSDTGLVTALNYGDGEVYVASVIDEEVKTTLRVHVPNPNPEPKAKEIEVEEKQRVPYGRSVQFTATVVSEDGREIAQTCFYESKNSDIVKVDMSGVGTGVGRGNAEIVVRYSYDPNISNTFIAEVPEPKE